MSEYTSNIYNIFTSRNNLLKQLKSSGYNTLAYDNFTINEIYAMERHNSLDFNVSNDNNLHVIIKYYLDKPIKNTVIQTLINELWNAKNGLDFIPDTHIIVIIIKDEPNNSLQELVKQVFAEENIYIILYNIKRLLFNILEHSLVPTHTILNKSEDIEFRNKYNVTSDRELPSISRFDPVSLAIFIRPNEICKITRSSVNAITSDYYRLCVNL
jgi:DNA-directed RNA polymerase subunit H (RpoH/RPB5)